MSLPRFVIAWDERAAAAAAAELRGAGLNLHEGCNGPEPRGPRALVVLLASDVEATAALLAATRGVPLVIDASETDMSRLAPFVEDLRRVGPIEFRRSGPVEALDPEQRRLLALLASGLSIGAAARRLFLSRRTADRRLAAARAALDVATTAEAIVMARNSSVSQAG